MINSEHLVSILKEINKENSDYFIDLKVIEDNGVNYSIHYKTKLGGKDYDSYLKASMVSTETSSMGTALINYKLHFSLEPMGAYIGYTLHMPAECSLQWLKERIMDYVRFKSIIDSVESQRSNKANV